MLQTRPRVEESADVIVCTDVSTENRKALPVTLGNRDGHDASVYDQQFGEQRRIFRGTPGGFEKLALKQLSASLESVAPLAFEKVERKLARWDRFQHGIVGQPLSFLLASQPVQHLCNPPQLRAG